MGKMKEVFMDEREAEAQREDFLHSDFKLNSDSLTDLIRPTHLTKAAMEGVSKLIADVVQQGNASALDIATKLQWMIATLEQARKLIQEDCVIEIEKHSGKATINGAEVIKKETGTKYDYEACGDAKWQNYAHIISSATESRKEREAFLKALKTPLTVADEETGEMMTLNPPIKSSTTNIQVTFK